MNEIFAALQSPGWWFTAIASVAISEIITKILIPHLTAKPREVIRVAAGLACLAFAVFTFNIVDEHFFAHPPSIVHPWHAFYNIDYHIMALAMAVGPLVGFAVRPYFAGGIVLIATCGIFLGKSFAPDANLAYEISLWTSVIGLYAFVGTIVVDIVRSSRRPKGRIE